MKLIEVRAVRKRFGATVALDGVDLDLEPGQVHGLIGENGAGKSTLMNILAGSLRPDSGAIRFDGRPYAPCDPADARRIGVSLIHQELSLCPHLTVAENIVLGSEPKARGMLDRAAMRRRALNVLEHFHHPEIRPDRLVRELSLPARQVVEICRAFAARSRVVLMDEPTSSLQGEDIARLFERIRGLRDKGVGVLYISHQLEEVRALADRYTVLRDGKAVAGGEPETVSDDALVSAMVGRPVERLYPRRDRPPAQETALEVRGLASSPQLRDATFQLRRGEVLGIAGLMGSGRTAMVRAIFGLAPVSAGEVRVSEPADDASARRNPARRELGRLLPHAATAASDASSDLFRPWRSNRLRQVLPQTRIAQGIGYLSEDRQGEGLALSLSLADNITATRFASCSRWGWLDLRRQFRLARDWMNRLTVKASGPAQPVGTLSGGNQQKVALARLLHQHCDILLLDEPTRGIDIACKSLVYRTIAAAAEGGKSILLVSSYLPELFGLCDRLAVMRQGSLSAARPVSEWTPESVMHAAIGR